MAHKWGGMKCKVCGLRRLYVETSARGRWGKPVPAWTNLQPGRYLHLYAPKGTRVWSTLLPVCVAE